MMEENKAVIERYRMTLSDGEEGYDDDILHLPSLKDFYKN